MCELGFLASYRAILSASEGGEGLVLGGSTENMVEQYFFPCFMVSIDGGVEKSVPLAMAVERKMCAPGQKLSKECLMVMCCGNASGKYKLKLVVISYAKRPRTFNGTKANCIPVHYYNQKSMDAQGDF
jgi:hypothetical protein